MFLELEPPSRRRRTKQDANEALQVNTAVGVVIIELIHRGTLLL